MIAQNAAGERLPEDRHHLVTENLRLVEFATRRFLPPIGMDLDEWRSECSYMICRAAIRFDESLGVKFSTFYLKCVIRRRFQISEHNLLEMRDVRKTTRIGDDEWQVMRIPSTMPRHSQIMDCNQQLNQLLRMLPNPDWKEIFRLKSQGYCNKEIGQIIGKPRKSIKDQWQKINQWLQIRIKRESIQPAF